MINRNGLFIKKAYFGKWWHIKKIIDGRLLFIEEKKTVADLEKCEVIDVTD